MMTNQHNTKSDCFVTTTVYLVVAYPAVPAFGCRQSLCKPAWSGAFAGGARRKHGAKYGLPSVVGSKSAGRNAQY